LRAEPGIYLAPCPSARNRGTHARLDSTIVRAPTRRATCAAMGSLSLLKDATNLLPARAARRMSKTSPHQVRQLPRVLAHHCLPSPCRAPVQSHACEKSLQPRGVFLNQVRETGGARQLSPSNAMVRA